MMDKNWKNTFNFLLEYKMKSKYLENMNLVCHMRIQKAAPGTNTCFP